MNKLRIIKLLDELIAGYSNEFPINNSIQMMKVLNLVMEYHIKKQPLSLKVLYTELNVSNLCARSNIKRMEDKGWLSIEKLKSDSRVRVIKPTKRLIHSYDRFYQKISTRDRSFGSL